MNEATAGNLQSEPPGGGGALRQRLPAVKTATRLGQCTKPSGRISSFGSPAHSYRPPAYAGGSDRKVRLRRGREGSTDWRLVSLRFAQFGKERAEVCNFLKIVDDDVRFVRMIYQIVLVISFRVREGLKCSDFSNDRLRKCRCLV